MFYSEKISLKDTSTKLLYMKTAKVNWGNWFFYLCCGKDVLNVGYVQEKVKSQKTGVCLKYMQMLIVVWAWTECALIFTSIYIYVSVHE